MGISFMIKYGEYVHLKQLIDGSLRFTPSQTYVKIEELQHSKGQGDLLEGKIKLQMESATLHNIDTHHLLGVLPNQQTALISLEDVSTMPIFCLSYYESENSKEKDGKQYISLDDKHLRTIQQDFSQATYALIILEPNKFIHDVTSIEGCKFAHRAIQYFDYNINQIQLYMYLTTGETKIRRGEQLSMKYKDRYRALLCKDISFENQKEYRFINLNEQINKPVFYPFKFTSKYMLVPINELKKDLEIDS